jgi:hypothetical protein
VVKSSPITWQLSDIRQVVELSSTPFLHWQNWQSNSSEILGIRAGLKQVMHIHGLCVNTTVQATPGLLV